MGQVRREHDQSTHSTANARFAFDVITGRHAAAALVSPRTSLAWSRRGDDIIEESGCNHDAPRGADVRSNGRERRNGVTPRWCNASLGMMKVQGHGLRASPRRRA